MKSRLAWEYGNSVGFRMTTGCFLTNYPQKLYDIIAPINAFETTFISDSLQK